MGLFQLFKRKNRISYKSAINLIYDMNIHTLRSRVKVLIVDDEKFTIVDLLKEHKYDIYYKSDITYAVEAEAFDVIIIDIKGIGQALGSSMGGFAIASDIKKRYPAKQVWCYSGSTVEPEIMSKIHEIDGYILKDTSIDEWCQKLDGIIQKYCSRDYQISVLRKQLEQCNIESENIEQIIKEYQRGLEKKNFNAVTDLLMQVVASGKQVVELVEMIYSFASHFVT